MQKDSHIFDDLARVAGGAMSSISTFRDEAEARLRTQFERILASMDLVRRDEFEAVKAMATKARRENTALAKRLDALEGKPKAKTASRATKAKAPARRAKPKTGAKASRAKTATKSAARTAKPKTRTTRPKAASSRRPAKSNAARRRKS